LPAVILNSRSAGLPIAPVSHWVQTNNAADTHARAISPGTPKRPNAHARKRSHKSGALSDRDLGSRRRRLRQNGKLLLKAEPPPPLDPAQHLALTIRHRSCATASSTSARMPHKITPHHKAVLTECVHSIDPRAWLADVLARQHPASRTHELLPWNWQALRRSALPHSHCANATPSTRLLAPAADPSAA
jgi:hypothetical protein